jgi:hypothetical protein
MALGHLLYLGIDSDTVNFATKVRCPSSFMPFGIISNHFKNLDVFRRQDFCKSLVYLRISLMLKS